MSLRDWLKNGWLTEHETTRQEIEAREMIDLAKGLRDELVRWLRRSHADVVPHPP